jgi:hypothetical protein
LSWVTPYEFGNQLNYAVFTSAALPVYNIVSHGRPPKKVVVVRLGAVLVAPSKSFVYAPKLLHFQEFDGAQKQ